MGSQRCGRGMAEGATIMYPAFLSFAEMKVMFTGAPWPRSQFGRLYCWAWYGSRPVISAAREGVQIAWAEYHWVKRAPSAAILLMDGVSVDGAP